MRISDWSSDVCSSDLAPGRQRGLAVGIARADDPPGETQDDDADDGNEQQKTRPDPHWMSSACRPPVPFSELARPCVPTGSDPGIAAGNLLQVVLGEQ